MWIIGAGGIGLSLASLSQAREPILISRRHLKNTTYQTYQCNYEKLEPIRDFCQQHCLPDTIIIANGILHDATHHPEKSVRFVKQAWLLKNIQENVLVALNWLQVLQEKLTRSKSLKIIILSARIGSISDNHLGGWYSYRMSKAMLNMLIKTTAIEWGRLYPNVTLVGYHPGTVDTRLSKPFQQNIHHEILTPDSSAASLFQVIDKLTPNDSGCLIDYKGHIIPF